MRTLFTLALILVLGVAWAAPAWALDTVIMSDGSTRRGTILEVQEDGIRVRFSPKSGGTAEMKLPASRLDPHFFYSQRDAAAGDDAKAHLKLALWCVDANLFSRAKIQVERAAELDPQLVKDIQDGKLPDIREGIAKRVLASAQSDIEKEDFDNAERKLEALLTRMSDTEAGTEAREVYSAVYDQKKAYEARKEEEETARLAEEEQKRQKALKKKVDPIKKNLDKARDLLSEGLVEDSESKALSLLQRAVNEAQNGLKKMDRLRKDFAEDQEVLDKADEVEAKVIAGMVKAHLSRADIYTSRGSTSNARKEIEKARKLDPDNPDVASAEQRADTYDDQDALNLRWQRNRREGMRFRGGGAARGGGMRGGGGGGRRR